MVTSEAGLVRVVEALRREPILGIDSEFYRDTVYAPQLCLLQVASPHLIAIIDVLKLPSLGTFDALLAERDIEWVIHAAKGDLEALDWAGLTIPSRIFDTQLAAAFSGMPRQVGYAELVRALLNQTLDKSATRSDWRKRPLSEKQLIYAVEDVRHLLPMAAALKEKLSPKKAKALTEESRRLANREHWRTEPTEAWRRVKGCGHWRGKALALIAALAETRENLAMEFNLPTRWVAEDSELLQWAEQANPERLSLDGPRPSRWIFDRYSPRALTPAQRHKAQAAFAAALEHGQKQRPPSHGHKRRLTSQENDAADHMKKVLKDHAEKLGIAPELLATSSLTHDMIRARPESRDGLAALPGWSGWRDSLAGDQLWDVLGEGQRPIDKI